MIRRQLTVEEADRLAQERPPYPPPSNDPIELCTGPSGYHRPAVEDWNRGNRESSCTWCGQHITRKFGDPIWRTVKREEQV